MFHRAGVLILCVVLLQTAWGQVCDEFEVILSTDPENNYRGQDVNVYCEYNASTAESVTWRWKQVGTIDYDNAYYAFPTDVASSEPAPGFENELDGKFVDATNTNHALIIINGTDKYLGGTWDCIVTTPLCLGDYSNEVTPTMKDLIRGGRPTLYSVEDDAEICSKSDISQDRTFICNISSDPQSMVALSGSALKDIQEKTCEKDGDGLWACSVSATYAREGTVSCEATFPGDEAMCAGGDCETGIIIDVFSGGLTGAEIALIVVCICLAFSFAHNIYCLVKHHKGNTS